MPIFDDPMVQALLRDSAQPRRELSDAVAPGLRLRLGVNNAGWSFLYRNTSGRRARKLLGEWPVMSVDRARQAAVAASHGAELDGLCVWGLVELYWEARLAHQKRGASTQSSMLALLYPVIDRDVCTLRGHELRVLLGELAERAPTHARRTRAYVTAMFSWALREGLMDGNPLERRFVGRTDSSDPINLSEAGSREKRSISQTR